MEQTKEITLVGGAKVTIPVNFKYGKCRGCNCEDIIWGKTKNGKNIPIHWVENQGFVCHFSGINAELKYASSS